MAPKIKRVLLKSIGFVILIVLLSKLNISGIWDYLVRVKLSYYLFGLSLFIPMLFFKSLRWKYLLDKQFINISQKESLIFYASGMFIGAVTPGRIGEVIKVSYIRNKGFSTGAAFFSVFVDRLSDILFLAGIGYIGTALLFGIFTEQIAVVSLFFSAIAVACVICTLTGERVKKAGKWLANFVFPEKSVGLVLRNTQEFMKSFKLLDIKTTILLILITAISWLFYYLQMFLFAKSLSLDVSFIQIIAIVSVATLIALIPVSIAGIGTRDASLVFLFSRLGLSEESAIAFSSLILLMMVINAGICSIGWFMNTSRKKQNVCMPS